LPLHNTSMYAPPFMGLALAISPNSYSQLGDNELQLYGPTSIFRLAPRTPDRPTFEESANGSADAYRSLSQENPDPDSELDWARHLPQDVPLTRPEHNRYGGRLTCFHLSALLNGRDHGLGSWGFYSAISHHGGFASYQSYSSVTCIAACPCQIYTRPSKPRTIPPCFIMPFLLLRQLFQMTHRSKTPLPAVFLPTRLGRVSRASANSQS
jgi:hypothetical protein